MTGIKISELADLGTPIGTEQIPATNLAGETPATARVTAADLLRLPKIDSVTTISGATTVNATAKGAIIVSTSASAHNVEFPAAATLTEADWPIGAGCWLIQGNTGTVTAVAGAGATLLCDGTAETSGQHGWLFVARTGADEWRARPQAAGGGGGSASGAEGAVQLSDGAGGFSDDAALAWDSALQELVAGEGIRHAGETIRHRFDNTAGPASYANLDVQFFSNNVTYAVSLSPADTAGAFGSASYSLNASSDAVTASIYILANEAGTPTAEAVMAAGAYQVGVDSDGNVTLGATICTAAGLALLDDADAAAQRTTMGAQKRATIVTISDATDDLESSWDGDYIRMTNTGAKVLNVRDDATHPVETGYMLGIRVSASTGNLTITPAGGVTITPPAGGTLVLEPGMSALLVNVGTDAWELSGQTVAA